MQRPMDELQRKGLQRAKSHVKIAYLETRFEQKPNQENP